MKILSHKLEELSSLKYNALVTVECDYCHNRFQKTRKIIGINIKRGSKHFFCNQGCLHKFNSQKSPRKKYTCIKCNKEVSRTASQIEKTGNVFCSRWCSGTHNAHNNRWKNHVKKAPKQKIPKQLFLGLRQNSKTKEIEPSKYKKPTIVCICSCAQCNKELIRSKYQLSDKKNKNKLVFCSRSCRMTHQNLNKTKKYGCCKSKAEIFLCELIRKDFPNLVLSENDRTVLPSKYEIDIYIKELKIAIELNGPFHYFPIFGEKSLKRSQNRDAIKKKEIQELGIGFIIIDISRLNSKKKTEQFLTEYYNSNIKQILGAEAGQ